LIWTIFVALLLLLPVLLGSYNPWTWSANGVAIAVLVLAWSATSFSAGSRVEWRNALWPPVLMYVAVILWIIFQSSPMSPPHPIWGLASAALGEPLSGSMSVAPDLGKIALIRLLSFGGSFWLAFQYGRDRDRAYMLLNGFLYAAGGYALYGMVNYIAGNKYLLWFNRRSYRDDVTGTFVNHNSYATYAGLALIVGIGLLIQILRRAWRLSDPSLAWPIRVVDAVKARAMITITILLVTGMAWLQTHSRMGFIATLCGLGALLLIGKSVSTVRSRLMGLVAGVLVLFALLSWSGSGLLSRFDRTESIDRLPIFVLAARAVHGAPLTGQGYGSFAVVLPMYRDGSLPSDKTYALAHNTYLELAVEIGLPAAVLLTACVLWLSVLCLLGAYNRSRDGIIPAIAFAAAVLIGTHATLDFSVQMPAIGCLFAALLGIGNAQAWSVKRAKFDRS
jgi:hypothetical protein